jgi:threonine aldolase
VDLRSDTVTQPTPAMREAMARAEVGDDSFGEDPTVSALEELAAERTGKEAALFVPSGTMANLIAVLVHVPRGGEVIADEESHLVLNEGGGVGFLAGAMVRTLASDRRARFETRQLDAALRDPSNPQHPRSALLMLENTHAHRMGRPLDTDFTATMAAWAHEHGLTVHVDGARLANAAVALGTDMRALLGPVDSGSLCLSKGLACPMGSLLVGTRAFIREAHRARKALGGAQRQVGIVAAAGLVALQRGPNGTIDRLADDHDRARLLASRLAAIPDVRLDSDPPATNIVIFSLDGEGHDPLARRDLLVTELAARGVLVMRYPRARIRAVTHLGITDEGIEHVVQAVRRALPAVSAA